jgi:hypothetical protein
MRSRLLALLLCAFPLSTLGQTYLYNQAVLGTGKSPIAAVTNDFNHDGQLDFAVANFSDNAISIILSKSGGSYASKVDYPVGVNPIAVVSGDFNGDGILDLAVANNGDKTISVLLGSASGTFSAQQTYPTGANPVSIVAVDLNGDKKLDLAAVNQIDGTVSILLGNGDGTFAGQTTVMVGLMPVGLAAADFTGDGIPDLAVSTVDGHLVLLTNNGQGGFTAKTTSPSSGGGGALVVGDLNKDGKPDLVFLNFASSIMTILIGDGAGNFQASTISAASITTYVTLGDLNGDGNLDIVTGSDQTAGPLSVFLGKGDGTFQQPIAIGFPLPAPGLVVGDFNHDNYLDVACLDNVNFEVVILLGDGKGNLTTRTDVPAPTLTNSDPNAFGGVGGSAVADVNHDGKPDVVALQYTQDMAGFNGFITVFPGNGDGTFRQAVTSSVTNFGIGQMVLGDFNGDGKIDVATSQDPTTGLVSVALGNGDGTFGTPIANPVNLSGMVIQDMIGGDFNNDGKDDLAATVFISANSTAQVYVFTSNGDGTFQPHLVDTAPAQSPSVAAGDFNHDGNLDLAATEASTATNPGVLVYLGKGDGTFNAGPTYVTGTQFTGGVQAADFNGDGKIDLTVSTDTGLDFFAGNGDGTFQTLVKTPTFLGSSSILVGDFNGDQKQDLASIAGTFNSAVFIGNGDGTFQGPALFQIPTNSKGLATVGDLNGDGTADLVQFGSVGNPVAVTAQSTSIWRSVPTIHFSAPRIDFATQSAGTTSGASSITLVNNGNAPLSISKIAASGSFAQTNTCTGAVAIGKSCAVSVTFTPTSAGPATGALTFTDNAYPTTQSLVLTGLGNPSDFSVSASPSSDSIAAGAAATYTATVTPIDGFTGTVQLACTGAPTKATCTLSKTSVTLDGTNSVNVTVTVTTTAPTTTSLVLPPSSSPFDNTLRPAALWSCLALLPVAALLMTRRRKLALFAAFGAVAFVLVACGGGSSGGGGGTTPGTPSGTYSLKITGTDGALVHTGTVSLTVQ